MSKSITVTITTETWGVKVSHATTLAEALVVARRGVAAIERRLLEDPLFVVPADEALPIPAAEVDEMIRREGEYATNRAEPAALPEGWEATLDGVSVATVDGVVEHSRVYHRAGRGTDERHIPAPCNADGSPNAETVTSLKAVDTVAERIANDGHAHLDIDDEEEEEDEGEGPFDDEDDYSDTLGRGWEVLDELPVVPHDRDFGRPARRYFKRDESLMTWAPCAVDGHTIKATTKRLYDWTP